MNKMETEDKLLKEFLKEGILVKAPDNFKEHVMMSVAKLEPAKKQRFDLSLLGFIMISVFAVCSSLGVIYFFDHDFFVSIWQYAIRFPQLLLMPFSKLFSSTAAWQLNFQINTIVSGTILIILFLLAIDKWILGSKRKINLHLFSSFGF